MDTIIIIMTNTIILNVIMIIMNIVMIIMNIIIRMNTIMMTCTCRCRFTPFSASYCHALQLFHNDNYEYNFDVRGLQ